MSHKPFFGSSGKAVWTEKQKRTVANSPPISTLSPPFVRALPKVLSGRKELTFLSDQTGYPSDKAPDRGSFWAIGTIPDSPDNRRYTENLPAIASAERRHLMRDVHHSLGWLNLHSSQHLGHSMFATWNGLWLMNKERSLQTSPNGTTSIKPRDLHPCASPGPFFLDFYYSFHKY